MGAKILRILDCADDIPAADCCVDVNWRGPANGGDNFSIASVIEEGSDILRFNYLSWLDELSKKKFGKLSLLNNLNIRPNLSYWWMTTLAEKSYVRSKAHIEVIKIMALESWVSKRDIRKIILVTQNQALRQVIRGWCKDGEIIFEEKKCYKDLPSKLAAQKLDALPQFLRALSYLARYFIRGFRLGISRTKLAELCKSDASIFDYFIHLKEDSISKKAYLSNYWGGLRDLLLRKEVRVNFIHYFTRHARIPSEVAAYKIASDFNESDGDFGSHIFLESIIGIKLLAKSILDYLKIYYLSLKLENVRSNFVVTPSNINVWHLIKSDWNDSLFGAVAMQNCIFLNSFELLFGMLPHQKFGLYLMENQSWEKALLYSWKSAGFGDIVGVPHTQINFWDLRFFKESFNNEDRFNNREPRPDYVALNGPPAISLLQNTSYSLDEIIGVEALRFNYLQEFVSAPKLESSESSVKKILILGDISEQVTFNQLKILADSIPYLLEGYSFVLRLHPACPINLDQFKLKNLTLSTLNESLADLLKGADLVYTSNSTSAAIEAYSANLPVISVYDEDGFNMSPLKKIGAIYVNSGVQLAKAIIGTKARSGANPPYFYLDINLGRWENLINFLNR